MVQLRCGGGGAGRGSATSTQPTPRTGRRIVCAAAHPGKSASGTCSGPDTSNTLTFRSLEAVARRLL